MIRPERGENGSFKELAFVRRRRFGFIHRLTVAGGKALPAEWNGDTTNERQRTHNKVLVHALSAGSYVLEWGRKL